MADDLAAALEEIRERHAARSKHAQGPGADPADFRRLLAAVEAALELVTEWKQIPFAVRASDECADELREAIAGALDAG